MFFFASVIYIFVLDWSCSAVVKRLLLTNYVFFRCCGEAAEKKNGSTRFTLLSLLTILFVCFSAAKFTYIIFLFTILLCVSLRRSRREKNGSVHFTLLTILLCVPLRRSRREKNGSVHLQLLCGAAAKKNIGVCPSLEWQTLEKRKLALPPPFFC